MCGIFGIISNKKINIKDVRKLALHARQRGRDSSGILYYDEDQYVVKKANFDIKRFLSLKSKLNTECIFGHSRLITNGLDDNQPVVRDNICVLHNGIVVNADEIWSQLDVPRLLEIDTEVIAAIALQFLSEGGSLNNLPKKVLGMCRGTVACAMVLPRLGKVLLFSNNGSLYIGKNKETTCFSSEKFPLESMGCQDIEQIFLKQKKY